MRLPADKTDERVVRKANRMRMDYLLLAFSQLGIEGDEAQEISLKKRRSLIAARVKMLTTV
jgi:hypothetical protein